MGEYYREHAAALAAVASLLGERLAAADRDDHRRPLRPRRAPAARARALPRRIDAFVGREREVDEVRRLLATSPLVTLVGPGGVGKTRLALEVGGRPVASRTAPGSSSWRRWPRRTLVAPAVAAAVGAPVAGDPTRALVEWLGDRRGPAACWTTASTWSRPARRWRRRCSARAPGCGSWRPAASRSAWPARSSGRCRRSSPRTRSRCSPSAPPRRGRGSRSRRPTATRSPGSAPGWTGCRWRSSSPARAGARAQPGRDRRAARRRASTCWPAGGGGRAPARHQTLRATVEWSHDLLAEEERAALPSAERLRRLVRPRRGRGGRRRDGAELLARLVDRSLVEAEPRDEGTRYRLLETLRQYAGRAAGRGRARTAALRDRHLATTWRWPRRVEPGAVGRRRARRRRPARGGARQPAGRARPGPGGRPGARRCGWPRRSGASGGCAGTTTRAAAGCGPRSSGRRSTRRPAPTRWPARRRWRATSASWRRCGDRPRRPCGSPRRPATTAAPASPSAASRIAGRARRGRDAEPPRARALPSGRLRLGRRGRVQQPRPGGAAAGRLRGGAGAAGGGAGRVAADRQPAERAGGAVLPGDDGVQRRPARARPGAARPGVPGRAGEQRAGRRAHLWAARGWVLLDRGDVRGGGGDVPRGGARRDAARPRGRPPLATCGSPLYWLGVALLRRGDVERGVRLMAAGHRAAQRAPPGRFGAGPGARRRAARGSEGGATAGSVRRPVGRGRGDDARQAVAYALEEPERV